MTKRMWAAGSLHLDTSHPGYFDLAYGTDPAQKLDIWLPKQTAKTYPTIVFIHGGGFISLDKRESESSPVVIEALHRGYAAVSLNYRMLPKAHYMETTQDIQSAIAFVLAHATEFQLDVTNLIVWGGSAGGYLALMAGLLRPHWVKKVVAWYPITDFPQIDTQLASNQIIQKFLPSRTSDHDKTYVPATPLTESSDFPFHNTANSLDSQFIGESLAHDSLKGILASPINYLTNTIPPMLLQHGSGDEIIPMQQSTTFAFKAQQITQDHRVQCEIIPSAIHGSVLFMTPENYDHVFTWIKPKEH
ncbi:MULTISPECIES: alpha/beta hydrolase [Lactobacillaceae]|uniref:alpha/beta hydrolase n=1 Tax=Lactobacillaceae TaxID=33958 RepID=UPI0014579241|nr:alpha/beta hydrolase [Lactobacillus sp. HBUAS51381]NLR10527.1 alpha/beta hydrolase [Lactobacillus sp. HBUAS51381]